MTQENVKMKSYDFALRIIETYAKLPEEKQEFVLSKELLKSGTSICAKLEQVPEKASRQELLLQLSLSDKEVRVTYYLLRLLLDAGYLNENEVKDLLLECNEMKTVLNSLLRKMKKFPL